jgi:hypothetical protein
MQSQAPIDISITPDPVAPHAIERETGEAQTPEPMQVEDRPTAETPEPWQVEPLQSAEAPQSPELEPPAPAQSPEPADWDTNREPAQPLPITEWETGDRNTVGPVEPIEWLSRSEPLPEMPAVTVDTPQNVVDPRRIRFRDGPTIQNTFWVS